MTNTSGLCCYCQRLPGRTRLDGHCDDCFDKVIIHPLLIERKRRLLELSTLDKEITRRTVQKQGPTSSEVYTNCQCLCGHKEVSYVQMALHIEDNGGTGPDHRLLELGQSPKQAKEYTPPRSVLRPGILNFKRI